MAAGGINVQQMERLEKLKAFDATGGGVKGLVDSGFQKVPDIFVRPSDELANEFPYKKTQIQVPIIDLRGIHDADMRRKQITEEIRIASETWGFFQVVNHGIPLTVLDGMIDGVRKFHEQSVEEKKKFYSRDQKDSVKFSCNYDLFSSKTAGWRDTLSIAYTDQFDAQNLPAFCRDSSMEYAKNIETLGYTVHGIMSEILGLETDKLKNMGCSQNLRFHCHYYPACPEPELALGGTKHSDAGFLAFVIQDNSYNGLQVLHQGHWVDVEPIPGGLIVNIGDLLQLVSNGKFKSREHRVIVNKAGPRISVVCFVLGNGTKVFGPIKELISEDSPALYREVSITEYMKTIVTTGLDSYRALDYYKL